MFHSVPTECSLCQTAVYLFTLCAQNAQSRLIVDEFVNDLSLLRVWFLLAVSCAPRKAKTSVFLDRSANMDLEIGERPALGKSGS